MQYKDAKLRIEKWTDPVGVSNDYGTIRTNPENYYVATILNDKTLKFEGIEANTREFPQDLVTSWFNRNLEKSANQLEYNNRRKSYLDGKISHKDFYLWLAGFIGANQSMLPVSKDRIAQSKDEHLNDIPLRLWDNQDYIIRPLAYRKGLAWSLSDTVCVLKTLARI